MTNVDGPFEVDRGVGGKIKVNVVSVANLVALIGLIGTAFATWNGLTNKVDILSLRVENATQAATQIRSELSATVISRDGQARDLTSKVELIGNRLTAVETVLQRLERQLENRPKL